MKIFLLSDPDNAHTRRWVSSLAENGIEIFLFGLNTFNPDFYLKYANVQVESIDYISGLGGKVHNSRLSKLKYLTVVSKIKSIIKEFKPDILHAHYATSYGLIGALVGFHPYIISAWGSDIYCFPKTSFVHKRVLIFNLNRADILLSTSHVMADEMRKYTIKDIMITPFGVNLELFKKKTHNRIKDKITIGTVKSLAYIYGIDLLIKAFSCVKEKNPLLNLELIIAGEGVDSNKLKQLVIDLNLEDSIHFVGRVDHLMLPELLNSFDIYVALSRSESFGVAAIEAMACECPVVVSNAEGFREIVENDENGFIVPIEDFKAAADKIQYLIDNKSSLHRWAKTDGEELYNYMIGQIMSEK